MDNLIEIPTIEMVIGNKIVKADCAITDSQGTCLMYGELSTMKSDYEAGKQNWQITSAQMHQAENGVVN